MRYFAVKKQVLAAETKEGSSNHPSCDLPSPICSCWHWFPAEVHPTPVAMDNDACERQVGSWSEAFKAVKKKHITAMNNISQGSLVTRIKMFSKQNRRTSWFLIIPFLRISTSMGELGKNDFCFVVAVYDNGQEVFPPPRSFPSKIIQLSVAILLGKVDPAAHHKDGRDERSPQLPCDETRLKDRDDQGHMGLVWKPPKRTLLKSNGVPCIFESGHEALNKQHRQRGLISCGTGGKCAILSQLRKTRSWNKLIHRCFCSRRQTAGTNQPCCHEEVLSLEDG